MKTGDMVIAGARDAVYVYLYERSTGGFVCQSPEAYKDGKPLHDVDVFSAVRLAPKLEVRVKKASEIMRWLEDHGAEMDQDFDWCFDEEPQAFTAKMFVYCGKKKTTMYIWHPDWLEEVEV